jgi:hypothetical protein
MTPLAGLALTFAIEAPIVLLLTRRARVAWTPWLLLVAGVNAVAYTAFTWGLAANWPMEREDGGLFVLEGAVVLFEGTVYALAGRLGWGRALLASLVANLVSLYAGLAFWGG